MVRPELGGPLGDGATSREWTIRLFGGLRCERGDKVVTRLETRQATLLLVRLALSLGREFYREELAELLWPLDPVDASLPRLRQALWTVRKALGDEEVIVADRSTIALVEGRATTDTQLFESSLRGVASADRLARGLSVYGGPLMGGLQEEWLLPIRQGYSQDYVSGCVRLARMMAEDGRIEEAVEWAGRASQEDPLSEEAHALAIRLLAGQGRLDQALQRYRTYAASLREALDISPNAELRRMVAELQGQSLAQVAIRESAPIQATLGIKHPITRFFGRDAEIEHLMEWCLESTGSRLLTLVAPGGFGKTRLAVEVAQRASSRTSGTVVFIDLVDLSDGARLTGAVAEQVWPGPDRGLSPLERIQAAIGEQPALLILDNFEHVLEDGARKVLELLERLPRLRCLVTSRVKLGLPGEQAVPLLPLPVRAVGNEPSASVAMFLDRIGLAQGGVPLATQEEAEAICAALEGIPLAIELAAAQGSLLSVRQVSEQLKDRIRVLELASASGPERQRTLREAISWSYSTLDAQTQAFLRQLTVFRGGCQLDGAVAVTGRSDAARMLDSLCGLALVVANRDPSGTRFGMLETVREFLIAESPPEEQAATRARLRAWLTTVCATAMSHMISDDLVRAWYRDIEDERENIRGALADALEEDFTWGVQTVRTLGRFWAERGYLNEGRHWISAYVMRPGLAPSKDLWQATFRLATIHRHGGDAEGAIRVLEEAGRIAERLGSDRFYGTVVLNLAGSMMYLGRLTEAHRLANEAVEILRGVDSLEDQVLSQGFAAFSLMALGDYETAIPMAEENVRFSNRYGDPWNRAISKLNLGWGLSLAGRWKESRALLSDGIKELRQHGFRSLLLERIHLLIEHFLDTGELALADEAITECAEMAIDVEDAGRAVQALYYRGELLLRTDEADDAARAFAAALDGQRHPNLSLTLLCLDGLAGCALALGDHDRALTILRSVEALRDEAGIRAMPNVQRRHDSRVADAERAGATVKQLLRIDETIDLAKQTL